MVGEREGDGPRISSSSSSEAPLTEPNGRWDAGRKVRFLHALAERGDVRGACASVGMSRQSAYVLRRRDRVFAAGWAGALVLARQHAEEVLASRALDGVEESVWFRGELVGVRRRFDSRLLLAHLGRLDRQAGGGLGADSVSDLAERFDEVLALVSGLTPEADMVEDRAHFDAVSPVLPLGRADFVAQGSDAMCRVVEDEWYAARAEAAGGTPGEDACGFDWPEAQALCAAQWDGWLAASCGRVDALVSALPEGAAEGGDSSLWRVSTVSPSHSSQGAESGGFDFFEKSDVGRERNSGIAVIASEGRRSQSPPPPPDCAGPTLLKGRRASLGSQRGDVRGEGSSAFLSEDGEIYPSRTAANETKFARGSFRQIDDAVAMIGPAIRDRDDDAFAVARIGDLDLRAEGQAGVRGGQFLGVEDGAAGGAATGEFKAVVAGDTRTDRFKGVFHDFRRGREFLDNRLRDHGGGGFHRSDGRDSLDGGSPGIGVDGPGERERDRGGNACQQSEA